MKSESGVESDEVTKEAVEGVGPVGGVREEGAEPRFTGGPRGGNSEGAGRKPGVINHLQ